MREVFTIKVSIDDNGDMSGVAEASGPVACEDVAMVMYVAIESAIVAANMVASNGSDLEDHEVEEMVRSMATTALDVAFKEHDIPGRTVIARAAFGSRAKPESGGNDA